jgi:rod shape-determining protein MreC
MVFSFLSILLMFLDSRYNYVIQLRSALLYMTSPIQYVVNWPTKTYQWLTESVSSHRSLLNENIELRYQQVLLKGKLQRLMNLQKENKQLRQLLDYKVPSHHSQFLLAELLSVRTDPYRQMVVLDRGKKDNVAIGQAVFDATGVMGQIIEVGPLTSTVMLITDPKSAVPVKNTRTGERSILMGAGEYKGLSLLHLDSTSDIQVGDELLTSGLGRRFPEGYPVGVVKAIIREPNEAFIQVEVRPAAKISKSRLMLLTWHEEQDKKLLMELAAKPSNGRRG